MEKLLLIVGIIGLSMSAFSLLFSAFNWYGHRHVLDGSAELYIRLRQRMRAFLVIGLVLAVFGVACLIIRTKV